MHLSGDCSYSVSSARKRLDVVFLEPINVKFGGHIQRFNYHSFGSASRISRKDSFFHLNRAAFDLLIKNY